MDEDEFLEDQHTDQFIQIKGLIPANPICVKPTISEEPKPIFKMQLIKNQITSKNPERRFEIKHQQSQQESQYDEPESKSLMVKRLSKLKCKYTKFDNSNYNELHQTQYFPGLFIDRRELRKNKKQLNNIRQLIDHINKGPIITKQQIQSNPSNIRFDSHFESGNLFAAYQKNQKEYDLVLQNDINSRGNTQWFYFSVTNMPKDTDITFNIINLTKCDSLFNYGMQPAVYSKLGNKKQSQGWKRSGKDISYFKNQVKRQNSKKYFYTLTFKIRAQFQNDTLFIANCFPYSYSTLQEYIDTLMKSSNRKSFVQRSIIGKSIGYQNIEALTIANPLPLNQDNRKILVFMARQHPGESQGSFVCQGIIDFLVSKSKQADFLRSKYIIKVIPMINPDGVIFGNYRSNLAGYDLNRKWNKLDNQQLYPEITCIRSYIAQLQRLNKIKCIIDLHGHSKKLSSFFYGNPNQSHPELVRLLPYLSSKLNPNQISFQDSTFTIQEQKKKTARVYLGLTHQIPYVYTYQVSFFGFIKDNKKIAFGIQDFKRLGSTLCLALYNIMQSQWLVQHKQKASTIIIQSIKQLTSNTKLMQLGNRNSSGSDSQPQMFQLKEEDRSEIQEKMNSKNKALEKVVTSSTKEKSQITESNMQSSAVISELQNSNCTLSTGLARTSKQPTRQNHKKLIAMSLNKVNSTLPDKFQIALQPISSKKQTSFRHQKNNNRSTKNQIGIQTNYIGNREWATMTIVDVQRSRCTDHKSSKIKQTRYASLSTTSRIRKNVAIKVQLASKPLFNLTSYNSHLFQKFKDQNIQTNLTSYGQKKIINEGKFRSTTYFKHSQTQSISKIQQTPIIRALKIRSFKQNRNLLFQDMIKKHLVDSERSQNKISSFSSSQIILQQSRFGDSIQKSLSIKKKQIAQSVKHSRKKSG